MRSSNADVRATARKIPELQFEDQSLTSFSGLVAFQALFLELGFAEHLRRCTHHLSSSAAFLPHRLLLVLTVHLLLGWRRLRDLDHYRDDPLVGRTVGLDRLPSTSCLSRGLAGFDTKTYDRVRALLRGWVTERLVKEDLATVTVDFDGSVLSTKGRRKEGTAIGYNHKKGQRSYYPLFATVAQTGQVFDFFHRSGNVHDSNGAWDFMNEVFSNLRKEGYFGRLETRFDGAHFKEATCLQLEDDEIEYSGSVPFERLPGLKRQVERRKRWTKIDDDWSYFEVNWKPESWFEKRRFVVYRQRVKTPKKGPMQLDFFEPVSRHFEYKAIVTSKKISAANLLKFHNGRGSQEGLFAELKSQLGMGNLPSRTLIGNKIYLACAALAHNLNRELQMRTSPRHHRRSNAKRAALWIFEQIGTFRKRVVQRAGRLTKPQGVLTLSCSANRAVADELTGILRKLSTAG